VHQVQDDIVKSESECLVIKSCDTLCMLSSIIFTADAAKATSATVVK